MTFLFFGFDDVIELRNVGFVLFFFCLLLSTDPTVEMVAITLISTPIGRPTRFPLQGHCSFAYAKGANEAASHLHTLRHARANGRGRSKSVAVDDVVESLPFFFNSIRSL